MKHPLTSKERRGLTAVAAAALLCIASGFIFRSCSSRASTAGGQTVRIVDTDTLSRTCRDTVSKGRKKEKAVSAKRKRREKGRKAVEKKYPVRDPLSEPCD